MLGLLFAQWAQGQTLQTRPERTRYTETSRYEDVMTFLRKLPQSPMLHQTNMGYSMEGRELPLLVWGKVRNASPEAVKASGKLRFFVMANIHAGEVEGKEAMLALLRELAQGKHKAWADSVVVLIAPIYNADGNERIRLTNRPLQNGPIRGMGQRPNAQDLDLNRDHMKVKSPEARGLMALLNAYDPHVWMDLHTTDGSVHGYHLTYAPPLHPNTNPEMDHFLREVWLPDVTRAVKSEKDWDIFHYGNLPETGPGYSNADQQTVRGWYSYDHRPRFSTNYAGLRNMFGILSEAYSYATFQERIEVSKVFVQDCIRFAWKHARTIQRLKAQADAEVLIGESLAVRATLTQDATPKTILLGEVSEITQPYTGETMWQMKPEKHPEVMPVFLTFTPTEKTTVPAAYIIAPERTNMRKLLETHGIQIWKLPQEQTLEVEQFQVDTTWTSKNAFQGAKERTVKGHYVTSVQKMPAESVVVSMRQPLARLIFSLLEPRSDDGVVTWNYLDEVLEKRQPFPIFRVKIEPKEAP